MGENISSRGNSQCTDPKAFKMLRGPGKVGEWGRRAVLGQLFRC